MKTALLVALAVTVYAILGSFFWVMCAAAGYADERNGNR